MTESEEYKTQFREIISDKYNISDKDLMKHLNALNKSCEIKGNKSFFRFRPFNEYTLSEIVKQEVYLAKLSDYDDAYEGRYLVDDIDVAEGVDQFFVEECNNYYRKNVRGACFTTDNKNIPMWYYYADRHQGMCIEYKYRDFDLPLDTVFLPIIYPKQYEEHDYKYLPKDNNQIQFAAAATALVKNRLWNFEKEWRIIKITDEENPVYVPLKIEKVHLGANVSEAAREVIKNIIDKNQLEIKLKEMVLTTAGLASFDYGVIPQNNKTRL